MNNTAKLYYGSYDADHRLVLLQNPRRQYPDKKVWEFDHTNPKHIPQEYGLLDTSVFVGNFDEAYDEDSFNQANYNSLKKRGAFSQFNGTGQIPHAWSLNIHGVVIGWDNFFVSPQQVYKHVRAMLRYTLDDKEDQTEVWDWVFNNITIKKIELDLQVQAASAPNKSWKEAIPKKISKIKVY